MAEGGRLYLGIDIGTSGVRAVAIDGEGTGRASAHVALPPVARGADGVRQDPETWWRAVCEVLGKLAGLVPLDRIAALAVDGTSGTVLVTDAGLVPLAPARMYNDQSTEEAVRLVDAVAPGSSMARGRGGALPRVLALVAETGRDRIAHAMTQADFIAARLGGRAGVSDQNNVLKLGYDLEALRWPDFIGALPLDPAWLPEVHAPGTPLGPVSAASVAAFGFSPDTELVAGTTDGNASFLAAGRLEPGMAVTALGTTTTLKIVSGRPVSAPAYGVYSHRMGDVWLAGGASNVGGAALLEFFTPAEMDRLSGEIDPETPSGLDYYPLVASGERFPVADPDKAPVTAPRPEDDALFFKGLLEGIARVEGEGYRLLAGLGAPYPREVATVGGGARNAAFTAIRQRLLGVPVYRAAETEAAYGTARLALAGAERRRAG